MMKYNWYTLLINHVLCLGCIVRFTKTAMLFSVKGGEKQVAYKSVMETTREVQSFALGNASGSISLPLPVNSFLFAGLKELFERQVVEVPWGYIPEESALGDFSHVHKPADSYMLLFDIRRTQVYWTGDQKQHSSNGCTFRRCNMCDGEYEALPDRYMIGKPWTLKDMYIHFEAHKRDFCRHVAVTVYDQTCYDLLKCAGDGKLTRDSLPAFTQRVDTILDDSAGAGNTKANELYKELATVSKDDEYMNDVYATVCDCLTRKGLWYVAESSASDRSIARRMGAVGTISDAMVGRLKVPLNLKHKYALGRPLFYSSSVDPFRSGIPEPIVAPTGMHSTGTFCKTVVILITASGVARPVLSIVLPCPCLVLLFLSRCRARHDVFPHTFFSRVFDRHEG